MDVYWCFSLADNSRDWLNCQFCALTFSVYDEFKSHTFSHFNTKKCAQCNVHLVQICNNWYELHSESKCQSNCRMHTFPADHDETMVNIKQEPQFDTEVDHLDEISNENNDVDVGDFGEVFTESLTTDIETNENHNYNAPSVVQHSTNNRQPKFNFQIVSYVEKKKVEKINYSKGYQCRFCDELFASRLRLDCHTKSECHRGMRNQTKCKQCREQFDSVKQLNKHLRECPWNNRRRSYTRSHPHRPAEDFICDICGRSLRKFQSLVDHMNEVHSSKSAFKCRICGRFYRNRYYQAKHMRRHVEAEKLGIPEEQLFGDLDEGLMQRNKYICLKPNEKDKFSNSEFECEECGQVFNKFYKLTEHKRTKHGFENGFQCRICRRCYPNRYYLAKHMKRHRESAEIATMDETMDETFDYQDYIYPEEEKMVVVENIDHLNNAVTFNNTVPLDNSIHPDDIISQENIVPLENTLPLVNLDTTISIKKSDSLEQIDLIGEYSIGQKNATVERRSYVRNHPHHPKSDYTCETCGLVFKKFELLKEHMTSNHSSESSFKCYICKRLYPNRYYLQKHIKKHKSNSVNNDDDNLDKGLMARKEYVRVHPHRPVSNITCDICNKVLSSYYTMKDHVKSKHSRKVKHPCKVCNKLFVSKKRLIKHKKLKHSKKDKDAPAEEIKPKVETKQMCSVCGRLFQDRSKMLAHEKTHFGIMASCEICNKKFLHKNYLRKHMRSVHVGERPFSCNIDGCEWTFSYPQCLKRHQARRHGMVIEYKFLFP